MFFEKASCSGSDALVRTTTRKDVNHFFPSRDRWTALVYAAAILLGPVSGNAAMFWETNKFDTGAGNWAITYNNTANANNVDWLNSNLAGGTAGELGGTFARHTSSAFYGRLLDSTITFNDAMHWRGVFSSTNTYANWNNSVFIGYFNTTEALADSEVNYIGWRNREPTTSTSTTEGFRSRARIGVQGNLSSPNGQYLQGQSYAFDVEWVPSGLNDGSGTFSGSIGGWSFSQAYAAQSSGPGFEAFGIWWDESAIDPNIKFDAYFDNLEYLVPEVPEPSAIALTFLGAVALCIRRRMRSLL